MFVKLAAESCTVFYHCVGSASIQAPAYKDSQVRARKTQETD